MKTVHRHLRLVEDLKKETVTDKDANGKFKPITLQHINHWSFLNVGKHVITLTKINQLLNKQFNKVWNM